MDDEFLVNITKALDLYTKSEGKNFILIVTKKKPDILESFCASNMSQTNAIIILRAAANRLELEPEKQQTSLTE